MRKGIILDFKKIKFLNFIKINKIFVLLSIIFVLGIFIGAFVFNKNELFFDYSKKLFETTVILHKSYTWFSILISSFLKYFSLLFLFFISGTSMFGIVIIPFISLWQGIVYGSLSSYLYSSYSLKGIAYNAIILMPPAIIFTVCSFLAARDSIDFSLLLAKLSLPKSRPTNIFFDFKKFCGKFIIFICISFFSSVTDLILNSLFINLFNF